MRPFYVISVWISPLLNFVTFQFYLILRRLMEVLRHLTENLRTLRSHQASYVGLLGYCTVLWCLTKVSWHLTRSLGGCLMRSFGNYGLMAPYGIWYRYLIMYLPRYLLLSNTFCCCCFQNTKSKNQIKLKYNFIFWTTLIRENY